MSLPDCGAVHPYLAGEHPIRLAHRGSRVLWPENTLEAFQRAVDLGYRYIETDVRATADGHVVVFHDATLERTTNGSGRVAEWRLESLQHLDAGWHMEEFRGRGVTVPTLREAYEAFPDVRFNLDMKARGIEGLLADTIRACGRESTTLVGSFSDRRLRHFRRITHGRVPTSAGPREAVQAWMMSRAGRHPRRMPEAYQLPPSAGRMTVDRRYVDAIHAGGSQVHIWTINEPREMHRFLDMGVDGLVTDRPDLLNDVLAERAGDEQPRR